MNFTLFEPNVSPARLTPGVPVKRKGKDGVVLDGFGTGAVGGAKEKAVAKADANAVPGGNAKSDPGEARPVLPVKAKLVEVVRPKLVPRARTQIKVISSLALSPLQQFIYSSHSLNHCIKQLSCISTRAFVTPSHNYSNVQSQAS